MASEITIEGKTCIRDDEGKPLWNTEDLKRHAAARGVSRVSSNSSGKPLRHG